MQRRGFFHADRMVSAYTTTHLTLSGIFSLGFVATEQSKYQDRNAFYPHLMAPGHDNALLSELKGRGYRIVTSAGHLYHLVSGGSVKQPCLGIEDLCLRFSESSALGYLELALLETTLLPRLSLSKARFVDTSLMLLGERLDQVRQRQPFFLWAHSLPPHSPFVFNADCTLKPRTDTNFRGWKSKHKQDYVDNVRCVNRVILDLVDRILAEDPNAIVVVQGDHGTAFGIDERKLSERPLKDWPEEVVAERASAMNLIRAPQECRQWLYPAISQVNTARFILACLSRRQPAYVPERAFAAWYESSPSFGEVRPIAPGGQPPR
jgi:hypothetical protein